MEDDPDEHEPAAVVGAGAWGAGEVGDDDDDDDDDEDGGGARGDGCRGGGGSVRRTGLEGVPSIDDLAEEAVAAVERERS